MSRAKLLGRNALVFGLLGALYACAPLSTARVADRSGCADNLPCFAQAHDLPQLLRYTERVSRMEDPAQRREHALAAQAFARDASAFNRLRLALLLTLPDTSFQCDSCARDLIREYLQADAHDPAWRDFAALLLRSAEQNLQLRRALDTERKQRQQALEQLDKLKAIEQRLSEREREASEPVQTP
jgi:hypothetical protein